LARNIKPKKHKFGALCVERMKCEAEVRDINYWLSYNISSMHVMCRNVCIEAGGGGV
jgi:hypothetical protein